MRKKSSKAPVWNLSLLYASPKDPRIERDMRKYEALRDSFAKKYGGKMRFLKDPAVLLSALRDLENIRAFGEKPILYFNYLRDMEAENKSALSMMPLLENRM